MVYYKTILEAAKHFEEKKAFLFDMDGLIFDTEQLFMEQLAIVMKEHGYTLTKEFYIQSLGLTGETLKSLMCGAYGEEYPFAELSAESRRRVSIVAETVGLRVKPGIRQLLGWLCEHHKNCAVVSSTHAKYVRKYLEYAGIDSYFKEVIGGDMVERSKPEPDILDPAHRSSRSRLLTHCEYHFQNLPEPPPPLALPRSFHSPKEKYPAPAWIFPPYLHRSLP